MADGSTPIAPPHNLAAEAAVLGAILYDNAVADHIWELCRPEDFYAPAHQWLARKCKVMIDTGRVADGVTIQEAATQEEKIAEIGGPQYLMDLLDASPLGIEARDYARIVADLAARRRLIRSLSDAMDHAVQPPDGWHPPRLFDHARRAIEDAEALGAYSSDTIRSAEDAVGAWLDKLEHHAEAGTRPPSGVSTGLVALDKLTGRWQPGELVVLAGRPSMGKTSLAANIAQRATVRDDDGNPRPALVAFLSLEMSEEPLAMRWAAQAARRAGLGRVAYTLARDGRLNRNEIAILREGWRRMPKTTLWETKGKLSIDEVRAAAKHCRRRLGGLDLLVIDYLQIMRIIESRNGNRASDIGEVTSDLKALAKELGIPVLCLSQLSRKVEERENKRPTLSDLRESGAIEQDADIVLFAYRDAYYLERAEPKGAGEDKWHEWNSRLADAKGVLETICAKARMGAVGTATLHFEPETDTVVDDKRELKEETLV